ncbi:hypothetical protein CNEO_1120016 [Clostridium neonatale]|nr:hypothetical protein CNEO_1120016 [Clostridium neonatale]
MNYRNLVAIIFDYTFRHPNVAKATLGFLFFFSSSSFFS